MHCTTGLSLSLSTIRILHTRLSCPRISALHTRDRLHIGAPNALLSFHLGRAGVESLACISGLPASRLARAEIDIRVERAAGSAPRANPSSTTYLFAARLAGPRAKITGADVCCARAPDPPRMRGRSGPRMRGRSRVIAPPRRSPCTCSLGSLSLLHFQSRPDTAEP